MVRSPTTNSYSPSSTQKISSSRRWRWGGGRLGAGNLFAEDKRPVGVFAHHLERDQISGHPEGLPIPGSDLLAPFLHLHRRLLPFGGLSNAPPWSTTSGSPSTWPRSSSSPTAASLPS